MSCKYLYNGEWLTEDQLRLVYQKQTVFEKNETFGSTTFTIGDDKYEHTPTFTDEEGVFPDTYTKNDSPITEKEYLEAADRRMDEKGLLQPTMSLQDYRNSADNRIIQLVDRIEVLENWKKQDQKTSDNRSGIVKTIGIGEKKGKFELLTYEDGKEVPHYFDTRKEAEYYKGDYPFYYTKEYSTIVFKTKQDRIDWLEQEIQKVILKINEYQGFSDNLGQKGTMFQKTKLQSSKASPATIKKVKEWLSRVGITIESLDTKRWGGYNGIAHLLRNIIEIAEGKENVALTEEAMHFAVDMIKHGNPQLYKKMFNKIGQYNIYQLTRETYRDYKDYRNPDGTLNIPKIKEEAMGKLLAEYLIRKEEMDTEKPEFLMQTRTWWQAFVDWIKGLIGGSNFDPFEEAVNALPQTDTAREARISELAESIKMQGTEDFDGVRDREIVATIAGRLSDPSLYEETKNDFLGGDEQRAQEILDFYDQFLQVEEPSPAVSNAFADEMKRKLLEKEETFKFKKIENDKALEEDDRNYYEANIDGEVKRIGRTTEYAKKANIKKTGGKDYFANLSDEEKEYHNFKAIAGTEGHFDIERIIESATNLDGTLKPKDSFTINFEAASSPAILKVLTEFLIGSESQDGFLYQFEEGTVFLKEVKVLNEKVTTVNEKDEKVKGRAGTIDLLVLQPTKGAVIYDWKFIGMSDKYPEYKRYKQTQHQLQLGDYRRTLREGYGLKDSEIKAYAIPISGKYKDEKVDGEKIPILKGIKIGNVDMKSEERLFLLPVAPDDQITGNKQVDRLLSSLRAKFHRIYKRKTNNEDWFEKNEDLNALHDAIRSLQISLNFAPLATDALNFERSIRKVIDKYNNYTAIGKTIEEMGPVLKELADALKSSKYYSEVDKIFTSAYSLEEISGNEKDVETYQSLQKAASAAKTLGGEVQDIINIIVAEKSELEGVVNILSAEREAKAITNTMLESADTPIKSLNLMTKLALDARSADQIEAQDILRQFGEIYNELAVLAGRKGVSPLSLIADSKKHALISRIDPEVYDKLEATKKAAAKDSKKEAESKKIILSFIDEAKYKKLVMERIKENHTRIDERTHSENAAKNAKEKSRKKRAVSTSLDIHRDDFDGWTNGEFASLISKSLKEEENYSAEYKALEPAALKMHQFIVELNKRAKDAGYLGKYQGERFLAFINATLSQRVAASSNKFKEMLGSLKDMVTVQEYQEQGYGKKDVETGQLDRTIPAYFTSEIKGAKVSKDLLSIMSLYIKSLVHFETSKKLEDLFEAIVLMEHDKGHLESEGGRVVFQGDDPKVFLGNSVNAQKVQDYRDDQIYGINTQADDLIARGVGKVSSKENEEKRALSARKFLEVSNRYVQQLAVGLKALVALPNYFGAHIQSLINTGHFYRWPEYAKNHFKIIGSAFGIQGDIEKGLIDLIVPLNDENFAKGMRGIAWKQSARKWLSTISFQDFMMSTNRIPDVAHELTNALTWMENTMVVDGKLENIRQYLRKSDEFESKYRVVSAGGRSVKEAEKEFEAKVKEFKETKALTKIAKYDENDMLVIPGFDIKTGNLAQYRTKVVEYGRNITSQLSRENKAEYRRNIIASSFMMFKNWIVKQVSLRALDIKKNPTLDEWQYGRTRLFFKVVFTLVKGNVARIHDIITATPKGIELMRKMYEEKIENYYRKTGQKLEITEEEFFDMVRKELRSETKELAMLLIIVSMVFAVKAAAPPDDEEDQHVKNRWKFLSRLYQKTADELRFYYSPTSAESITRGTILPSLTVMSKVLKLLDHTGKEIFGDADKAHPLKYLFDLTPVVAQFQHEIAPAVFPEWSKEQGIRVSEQARAFR